MVRVLAGSVLLVLCAYNFSTVARADSPQSTPTKTPASQTTSSPTPVIMSQVDLKRYMDQTPASANPIDLLPEPARSRFLSSLTFNEKGITGFDYVDLCTKLTTNQLRMVLELFGVGRLTDRFAKDPKCQPSRS